MKKTIGVVSALVISTVMFTGCQNMSASDQRIGAAALGGAVGGIGSVVGKALLGGDSGAAIGGAIGGGAGAAIQEKK